MTLALCTSCGSIKKGTLLACDECGCGSTGNNDFDLAFTDHYLSERTLKSFGEIIKRLHQNSNDEAIVFWAFIMHISDCYPEILICEIPRRYRKSAIFLLKKTDIPEIIIEDSPRIGNVSDLTLEEKLASKIRHHRISCKSCRHIQSFAIWPQINGTLDPFLNIKITTGQLFMCKCRKCGEINIIPYETLYVDIEKRIIIWLRLSERPYDFTISPPSDFFNEVSSFFSLRTVSSPDSLSEKIRIYNDGHSDIMVELIKICICFQRGIDLSHPLYYMKSQRKFIFLKTMIFSIVTLKGTEEIHFSLNSQKKNIDNIMERIQSVFSEIPNDWLSIDRNFVMKLLQNTGMLKFLSI